MSERVQLPKSRPLTRKIVAATTAFALAPLAGCGTSPELQAREDATRQVFTDVIAGKTASKEPFGNNTFTISIKDKYPGINTNDASATGTAAFYTYKAGEERIHKAFGIQYDPVGATQELTTLAVCDTAAVNGLLTGDQLKTVQSRWDYYQQVGGQKELEKDSSFSSTPNDAYVAITSLEGICTSAIGQALRSGADVTFVPATNE